MLAQIPMVANFSLCTKTTAYNQIMSFTERWLWYGSGW
jgi:hypothetical protein